MIITDFDLEDEDDDESELKYLEVDTEDLETSNKSSSSADTKGLIKSISKSRVHWIMKMMINTISPMKMILTH